MDNPFATERNGHKFENTFDASTNSLDIKSNGLYPSNVLSNMYNNSFKFEGVKCGSMEGFLQSLKYSVPERQKEICAMGGGMAKKYSTTAWQKSQTLWWKGKEEKRDSYDFLMLVTSAYVALSQQNRTFRYALLSTYGVRLTHSMGAESKEKTILTATEFCSILTSLREELHKEQRKKTILMCVYGAFFLFLTCFCFHLCLESEPHVLTGKIVTTVMMLVFSVFAFAVPIQENLKIKRLKRWKA